MLAGRESQLWVLISLVLAVIGGSVFLMFVLASEGAFASPTSSSVGLAVILFSLYALVAVTLRIAYIRAQR